MKELIIENLFELAGLLIMAIITKVIIPAIAEWLKSKTTNTNMKTVIEDIEFTVRTCVDNLEQTAVAQYKANGSWNEETQKAVCALAIEDVMGSLLDLTKKTLADNDIEIVEYVRQHVEAYIQSKKSA